MKTNLLITAMAVALLVFPGQSFGNAIDLGTTSEFAIFSSNGAVSNTGISQVTGNVGTNSGSSTAFGNVNGIMHDQDGASAQASTDLLIAYNQLNSAIPDYFPASLLGNGTTLTAGTYSIEGASTLNLNLILDAQDDPNATFIFQISGSFSANAESKILLKNGAKACNVFWKIEGLVSMAPGVSMKGTVIANNAAIILATRDTIEGRIMTTTGAISIDGVLVYTPTGCGSPYLTGPIAPDLKSTSCFTLFSSNGPVTNTGVSTILGSVGTNVGLTTGFNDLLVDGIIHPIADGVTAQCAADLLEVYNYLNVLPNDIELLYPAEFGQNLVLTPHTYIMRAAAVFTDTLYLNAQGNVDAVFVIKIEGALTTSTFSNVVLLNGTQAKNVYWKIEGAVSINDYSIFCGTIVSNNGALGSINTGVTLNGRAFTTNGALNTASITSTMDPECTATALKSIQTLSDVVTIFPNPIGSATTIVLNVEGSYSLNVYNALGQKIINMRLTQNSTALDTKAFQKGIYFYTVSNEKSIVQSGKLISNK